MVAEDEQIEMEAALRPYKNTLAEIVQRAFSYYANRYGNEAFKHTPRTRANLINDHMVDEAHQIFTKKHPEIACVKANGRRLFEVPNLALLHLKRLDKQKRTRNYPTLFAINFNDPQEFLPGLGPLPRLAIGYVPSRDWTRIEGIFITRPDGKEVRWFIELGLPQVPPIPLTRTKPDDSTTSKRRARPKVKPTAREGGSKS